MKKIQPKYKHAVIATDVVIFALKDNELQVLLIKMKKTPYENIWALPGGLVGSDETLERSAQRQLLLKTGVKNIYLEQLYTFGKVNRDPFGRVVSVSYFALIANTNTQLKTTIEYDEVKWFPVSKISRLAYDHNEIIKYALERLKSKLEYTNIVYSLMPIEFTLTSLQSTYEIILGRKLDKRNFRKKILSLKLIKKTTRKTIGDVHRPASLYTFINKKLQMVEVL